jgi:hypothetical protein
MDFGVILQRSKNIERYERFQGTNGKTAYLIIAEHYERFQGNNGKTAYLIIDDHCTDIIWGISTAGKAPPLAWLNRWLAQYKPSSATFHCAEIDEGVEMANNPDVLGLIRNMATLFGPPRLTPRSRMPLVSTLIRTLAPPPVPCFMAPCSPTTYGRSHSTTIFSFIAYFHMGPGVCRILAQVVAMAI